MQRAEAAAFTLSNQDIVAFVRAELRLKQTPIRLSALPMQTAQDVLLGMQLVEAVRASRDDRLQATKLSAPLHTPYYSASDYQIQFRDDTDSNPA